MTRVNWTRLIIGGLVASWICFATDGLMHNHLLEADWARLFEALCGAPPPAKEHEHAGALISFFDYELGRGLGAVFLYVMMRARYGAGPKTALLAGVVAWLICSVSGPAQFIPLGLFSHALWWKMGAIHFVTTLAASLAGAAIYRERSST
jgi:hypothetical protein